MIELNLIRIFNFLLTGVSGTEASTGFKHFLWRFHLGKHFRYYYPLI